MLASCFVILGRNMKLSNSQYLPYGQLKTHEYDSVYCMYT